MERIKADNNKNPRQSVLSVLSAFYYQKQTVASIPNVNGLPACASFCCMLSK
jgi:hypothetical protein